MRFSDGRRPETATHVQVAAFDGPLALLLSLIEARQLDVLTVPLGGLAEAYLDALAGLEVDRIGNVSAFVAVASQLILIKSRAMLPRAVAPDAAGPGRTPRTPRPSCARGCSCTAPTATPGGTSRTTPWPGSACSGARRRRLAPRPWPAPDPPTRRRSTPLAWARRSPISRRSRRRWPYRPRSCRGPSP